MKKYNKLNPEVIVGLGERTEFLEKEAPFKTDYLQQKIKKL